MHTSALFYALAFTLVFGCGGRIEGTRDKSVSVQRLAGGAPREKIAIAPIRQVAGSEGLADRVTAVLPRSFGRALPETQIDGPVTVLTDADELGDYSMWAATYEMTSVMDPRPLADLQKALGARYLLLIRSMSLDRERIRASETGRTGIVSDANNVWRTDLKISAELVDLEQKRVVWKGLGHAEDLRSPRKTLDLGIIAVDQRNPEIVEYVDRMVAVASDGLALQLTGGGR